jgi:tetratricopeptide (TPR) repeat protein
MLENQIEQGTVEDSLCWNCKTNNYIEDNPNKICTGCRESFIKYPIPKWIWGFAGGILLIMIIGAFRMPAYVQAGLRISRADKFIGEKRFVSAQRELEKVLAVFPDNKNANGSMVVAASYNMDFEALRNAYDKIQYLEFDDKELLSAINEASVFIAQTIPKDTTLVRRIYAVKDDPEQLKIIFTTMDSTADQDANCAGVLISNYLFDLKEYDKCDEILKRVIELEPNFYGALSLQAALKRNTGDYDGAMAVCHKTLLLNKEDIGTLSQMARIELKRKNDKGAAKYAKQAMDLDPANIMAMEAQSMVDFYAGRISESKKLLSNIKKQETKDGDDIVSTRLSAIINKSETYR